MARKTLVVFLFFLACCTPAPVSPVTAPTPTTIRTPVPTHVFRETDPASIKAFKTSADCPNICWLGIHAGTTSTGQAVTLLKNSRDIRQMEIFNNYILAKWFPDDKTEISSGIGVSIDLFGSTVQSMSLMGNDGYPTYGGFITVSNFLSFAGEPDELKINDYCYIFWMSRDKCTNYMLYYSTTNTALFIFPGDKSGPAANDTINQITINVHSEKSKYLQPWLGYGHLSEYLLKPMPTITPYPVW